MWTRFVVALLLSPVLAVPAGSPRTVDDLRAHAQPSMQRVGWDPESLARPALFVTTNRNGLPQSLVDAIAFDAQGYLWVGTGDGAVMSNAERWTIVNMPNRTVSNYVTAICPDANGALWFGTREAGVSRLDNGAWTTFTVDSGLPSNRIRSILETSSAGAGHNIWATTDGGLAVFDGTRWNAVALPEGLPENGIQALFEVREAEGASSLWIGTSRGAARWTPGGWTTFGLADGLPSLDVGCFGTTTGDGGSRQLWIGTHNGLARFDGRGFVPVVNHELPSQDIRCLRETVAPSGRSTLWIGTADGLVRFSEGSWRSFSGRDGLPADTVVTMLDYSLAGGTRSLFVGMLGGLVQMDFDGWETLDTSAGLPSNLVYSILPSTSMDGESSLWVGTEKGLCRFADGKRTVFTRDDGLPANAVVSISELGDGSTSPHLFVGTEAGLARFDNEHFVDVPLAPELSHKEIRSVLASTNDTGGEELWVSALGGVGRFSGGKWRSYTKADGLPSDSVLAIAESRARDGTRTLWAATYGGLARFRNETWEAIGTAAGFPRGEVISLHVSTRTDGTQVLWAGMGDTGVARLELSDPQAIWLTLNDTTTPALPNNVVYQICEDRFGRIYLVTNRGVARLTDGTAPNPKASDISIRTFTTANGLPNNEGNAGASAVDRLGRIWVGTVEGAAVFDPAAEPAAATTLPLYIVRSARGSGVPFGIGAELSHDDSDAVFEYALLDYSGHGAVEYRTQLYGLDDAPSDWTGDAKKEYTRVPAGSYSFQVWARDHNGVMAGPTILAFVVRPAPWRTWWAYLLYGFAVAALVYAGMKLRFRALERNNEILEQGIHERTTEIADKILQVEASERRAREEQLRAIEANRAKSMFLANMSHELRTPLNAILGFVQLMDRDRTRSAEDRENLAVIARSGENLLALILDLLTVSRIEAGGAALEEHVFDLHRLLRGIDEMFGAEAHGLGLHLTTTISPTVPRYVWGDENKLRQALIKVLGNSVKFTPRGSISLAVEWAGDRVTFTVSDTGCGIPEADLDRVFDPFVQSNPDRNNSQGAGLGLTIARSFIRLMGGEMKVTSDPGTGSTFVFDARLPLASGVEVERKLQRVVGLTEGQQTFRILVVDDVPQNRSLLMRMLAIVGLECREASSAHEALEIWESWHPDFIWMDTHMPGTDGLDATREIRRRETAGHVASRSIIVATTTSELDDERAEIFDAGFDDYALVPASEFAVFEKLAARLGVRYVYESAAPADEPYASEVNLTSEYLATLPTELKAQLHKAVLEGDVAGAMDVADLVRDHDDKLAMALRVLIRSYRFDELQELMESAH